MSANENSEPIIDGINKENIIVNTQANCTTTTPSDELTKSTQILTNNSESMATTSLNSSQNTNLQSNEGKRVQQLRKTVYMALEKTLPHCDMSSFAQYFSNLNEVQYKYLETVFNELKVFLRTSVKDELDLIMEETQVCTKLNELDQLQMTAEENNLPSREGHRDIKAPDNLIRNQSVPAKLKYKEKLLELLKGEEIKHQQMLHNVSEKRKQVQELYNKIDNEDSNFITKSIQTTAAFPTNEIEDTIDRIHNLL